MGPLTPPYNGQAIAFTIIADSIAAKHKIVINTKKFKNRYLNTFYCIFKTYYSFMFLSFSTIYFTSSRSKLGFLKELHLLLFGRWFNKRIINHLHGADFKSFYKSSGLLKPIVNYCYKGIEISIVLLSEMAKDYDDFPTMKTAIVTNCYPKEMDLFKNRVIKKNQIIYLSNLMYSKGILEFLDACSVLLKNDLTLEVKIAGFLWQILLCHLKI